MNDSFLVALLCVAFIMAVVMLLQALRQLRSNKGVDLSRLVGDIAKPNVGTERERERGAVSMLQSIGARLRPQGDALDLLRSRVRHAGWYREDAVDLFVSMRFTLLLLGMLGGLATAIWWASDETDALLALVITTSVAAVAPGLYVDRRAKERQAHIAAELPEVIELLIVSLEAGLGLQQALKRLSRVSVVTEDSVLRAELRLVLEDIELGMPLDRAFRRFAKRTGSDEAASIATLIARASALGAKMSEQLRNHAKTMRSQRLMSLEETAGQASAKLAIPLTLCLLPSGMLIVVGPAFLAIWDAF